MVLIVGGMAQGKLEFARRALGVSAWSEGALGEENCVHGLHLAIRALEEPEAAIRAWLETHPDGVVICDEVGCGITPLDRADREWREKVGRICCGLAERAEAVYRVQCGLETRLK
ncbi:MAG: bifunctional adenosylcobinamide kinase/adenosylcobinamide-phosphate guanylyltransferase [Oscillospiraceae bacterium]|nr:bifunctional adenosylcobinamide kinase/adenosylcobinamide-phosphate guanylyltransferase [Oscillospiraceae bacterium]